jgi:hypothetical protein
MESFSPSSASADELAYILCDVFDQKPPQPPQPPQMKPVQEDFQVSPIFAHRIFAPTARPHREVVGGVGGGDGVGGVGGGGVGGGDGDGGVDSVVVGGQEGEVRPEESDRVGGIARRQSSRKRDIAASTVECFCGAVVHHSDICLFRSMHCGMPSRRNACQYW